VIDQRIGAYDVIARLGEGGMGEVFRARDNRLGREVALKVLPLTRHHDPEAQARFEREARTLAALNSPHIAAIHDIVDVGDRRAIVMELVAGRTLAQLMGDGPPPLRTAVGYAIDIAEALRVAHGAGIVHRDLKPANIVITPGGAAKVLDFGIAKLAGSDASGVEETTFAPITAERGTVGTPAYMSPEQAHGHAVDARSDIFSFGAVLHEMVAGRRAFGGESTAAVISSVLRDDPPPLRAIAPDTPRAIERLVARCLQKDPQLRYQDATDLKTALEDIREDLAGAAIPSAPAPLTRATPARRVSTAVACAALGAAAALVATFAIGAFAPGAGLAPGYRPFVTEGGAAFVPAFSPDGRTIAYMADAGSRRLLVFLRAIDATQSTQLTSQEADGRTLFWSPDGSRLYFSSAGTSDLVSVSAGGGEPRVVIAGVDKTNPRPNPLGMKAAMSPDGRTIVFTRAAPEGVRLWSHDTATGDERPLDAAGMPGTTANVMAMAFAPDGASLALIASTTALNDARGVWVLPWPAGTARHLFADAPYLASNPAISWLPDSRRFVMNGYPAVGGHDRLLMADVRAGTLTALTPGPDDEFAPAVSPDGKRIAFVSQRAGLDLVQFPVDGGTPQPLIATSQNEQRPDISRSGMLAYVTDASGSPEVRVRAGVNGAPRIIGGAAGPARDRAPRPFAVRLSPDDQRVAVEIYGANHVIWIYAVAGGSPVPLDTTTTDQHGPSWSPDGNWIAFRRLRNGSWELVKAPLGGGEAQHLDDAAAGGGPTDWSPSGAWIAHSAPDGVHLVPPDGGPVRVLAGLRSGAFRFSRDGARLFAIRRGAGNQWELTIWDVASGREVRSNALPIPAAADVTGMTLSGDDSHVVLATGTPTSDIWLLEQFAAPAAPWARWLPR
jgi:Tol biopolymer transport system component